MDAMIQFRTDLTREPGDSVVFPTVRSLVGAGVTGNAVLEGNEEILNARSLKVPVGVIRHAVAVSQWDEQKSVIDLLNAAPTWSSSGHLRGRHAGPGVHGAGGRLAMPADDGGVDLFVSTQWLHVDRDQLASCAGPANPSWCGSRWPAWAGRSAAREDLSMQVHVACSRCTPASR